MRRLAFLCAAALIAACSGPIDIPFVPSAAPKTNVLRVLVTRAEAGTPVAGAHVCAGTASGATQCADATKDGTVSFKGPAGTYFVTVTGPAEQHWQEAQRVTDLVDGDAAVWVELTPLLRISGTVRNEANALVAGAQACAHPASDEPAVCAKTGTNGAYAIDVKPGIYRLDVSGPSGQRLVSQWARGRAFLGEADILDARTTDVPDVDLTLVKGVVLRGVVRFQSAVVEDAQVCMRTLAAPLPWECERTDKNGRYAALREPGRYFIWVVPPGNIRAVPQWYDRALTGVGSTAFDLSTDATLDVNLPTGPQVRGTVRTTSGEVVTGALVCIDTAFTTGRICRETDGNGRYTITTRPETYIISVLPPAHSDIYSEYYSQKRTWKDADDVVVGSSDVILDLTVRQGVRVTGTVKNGRGIPVAGATINFSDAAGVAAATDTDDAGRFEAVVLPGRLGVEVFPPFVGNLVGKTLTVDVRASVDLQTITLDDVAP